MKISPIGLNYVNKIKLNPVSFSNRLPADSFSRSQNPQNQEPRLSLKDRIAHQKAIKALKKAVKEMDVDLSDLLKDVQKKCNRQLKVFIQQGKEHNYKGYIPIYTVDNGIYRLRFENMDDEKGTMDIVAMSIDDNFKTKTKFEVLEGKGNYIYHDYRQNDVEFEAWVDDGKIFYMKHIDKARKTVSEYKQTKDKLYLMEGVIGDGRVVATGIVNIDYKYPENSYYMDLDDDNNMILMNFDSDTLDWKEEC